MPVNAIREAVRRAVSASSLRLVANDVGVAHGSIVKFLDGAKPQARTLKKLLPWYLRQQAGTLDREAAEAAIALLVGTVPEPQRASVRTGLLDLLREAHRRAGTEPPEWLK